MECLADFVNRLNKETLSILDLNPDVEVASFANGVIHPKLKQKLVKKPLATLAEVLKKAKGYIQVEVVVLQSKAPIKVSKRDDKTSKKQTYKEKKLKTLKTKSLFSASRSKILMNIRGHIPMDRPKPFKQRSYYGSMRLITLGRSIAWKKMLSITSLASCRKQSLSSLPFDHFN
ncbi:hypothetical protein Cgig2_033901 [Carnegiea gigantea]|uniref:Uncharacterized protein n=1 Tax=Carnegiea gigantea TaxID=171969 RepID=A0A9Q1GLM9_9CARY|nr:hypothetical protein Cgig2_033901 [Carnegiea gigantea]